MIGRMQTAETASHHPMTKILLSQALRTLIQFRKTTLLDTPENHRARTVLSDLDVGCKVCTGVALNDKGQCERCAAGIDTPKPQQSAQTESENDKTATSSGEEAAQLLGQGMSGGGSILEKELNPTGLSAITLSPLVTKWDRTWLGGTAPLQNNSVLCYINAIIQCLTHIPEVVHTIARFQPTDGIGKFCLEVCTRRVLIKNTFSTTLQNILPKQRSGAPQDSDEFLGAVLTALDQEPWAGEHRPVTSIFKCAEERKIYCESCKYESVTRDEMTTLHIPIDDFTTTQSSPGSAGKNPTVDSGISSYCKRELVEWTCPGCKRTGEFPSSLRVTRPPRSLVIHVERAQFVNASLSTKNEKSVEFSETLDLTPHTTWDQQSIMQRTAVTYKLQGVVMHHGSKSTKTGHYTACVRDRKQDSMWLHADDDTIKPTTFTVFSSLVRKSVSLLFYIREGHDDNDELRHPIPDGERQHPISPRAATYAQTAANGSVLASTFAQPPAAPLASDSPPSDEAKEEDNASHEPAEDSEVMETENARPKRTHSEAITTPTSSSQGSPMKPSRLKHKTGSQQTHSLQGNRRLP